MLFDKSKEEVDKDNLIPRRDFERLQTLAKVHQDYLNNIMVYYNLKPTPFLESYHDLSYELLRFFTNVSRKHNLNYWLDFGTLLGALRHEDFIPWDDNIDIGMIRSDYMKLTDVFQSEADLNNLNCRCEKNPWFKITCFLPGIEGKVCEINVYPYDYINGEVADGFEETYAQKSGSMEMTVDEMYDCLNLTFRKDKYYVLGVDGVHGKFPFRIHETDNLFPLKKIKFGRYSFPSPGDTNSYLNNLYGKQYSKIPKKLQKYEHLKYLRQIEGIEEIFKRAADEIRKINDNYDI